MVEDAPSVSVLAWVTHRDMYSPCYKVDGAPAASMHPLQATHTTASTPGARAAGHSMPTGEPAICACCVGISLPNMCMCLQVPPVLKVSCPCASNLALARPWLVSGPRCSGAHVGRSTTITHRCKINVENYVLAA